MHLAVESYVWNNSNFFPACFNFLLFSITVHCSFYSNSHFNSSSMSLTFWHYAYLFIGYFVDIQACCNIFKVTPNVTIPQIWVFLSNINIAWSTKQSDEIMQNRAMAWQEGRKWMAHFGPWETPATVCGPLNEGSLWVWAVGQAKMIAIKEAKPAGSTGASFHPSLTSSNDLLALMLSSVLLFSSSLSLHFTTVCNIPTPLQYSIRICLYSWFHAPVFDSV